MESRGQGQGQIVERRSPVQKVAGLLVEAGMIVFAVMVALSVEE